MHQTIEYVDRIEGFRGYLSYHGPGHRIAAGECRMQAGLAASTLQALAARVADQHRLLGLAVDGAACGIDYDPASPGGSAALRRFLAFLRAELGGRLALGGGPGAPWAELEQLAATEGMPSVKYAVRAAQELPEREFFERLHLLDERVGRLTVGQRRAGHALAHAALAAAAHLGRSFGGLRCAVQGFGDLGRAAAESLIEVGARVTAVSDELGCVVDPGGLDVRGMLAQPASRAVRAMHVGRASLPRDTLLDLPADVLVLAAGPDGIPAERADALPMPVVAVGASHGLQQLVERRLEERGVVVVPDLVAGAGDAAAMNAVFGAAWTPSAEQALDWVAVTMHELVGDVLDAALRRQVTAREAARAIAARTEVPPDTRPYGASPYLRAGQAEPARDRTRRAAAVPSAA